MAELKTTATGASVDEFLATVIDPARRADCETIRSLMQKITGKPAEMWGSSIVGFDRYRYTYSNGKELEWPVVGFSPRKQNLTLYVLSGFDGIEELLNKLGKHNIGKSCLYLKSLGDVDMDVLEEIIQKTVAFVRATHPSC